MACMLCLGVEFLVRRCLGLLPASNDQRLEENCCLEAGFLKKKKLLIFSRKHEQQRGQKYTSLEDFFIPSGYTSTIEKIFASSIVLLLSYRMLSSFTINLPLSETLRRKVVLL